MMRRTLALLFLAVFFPAPAFADDKPKKEVKEEPKAIDATKDSLKEGELTISVTSITFRDDVGQVWLKFENAKDGKPITLDKWLGRLEKAGLADNAKVGYANDDASFRDGEARLKKPPTLYAERTASACINFKRATSGVPYYLLELPSADGEKTIRFKLPRSMWEKK